ncbi:PhoD-like phosphatase-domain-containing protein [Terfezia claveryi]|nr:PhoD-like phosphatase-domain-containing protein [Terfezia claveryi]
MGITNFALVLSCALSSLAVRVMSYIFLRWIPGHVLPNSIYTAYVIFLASFAALYYKKPRYEVIAKQCEVKLIEADAITPPATAVDEDGMQVTLLEPEKPVSIETTETIIKRKNRPNKLRSILLGIPEPNSKLLTLANLLINTLLVGFTLDMVYRSEFFYPATDLSFARTGYVSQTGAKILLREPDASKLPLYIYHRIEPEESDIEYPWIQSPPLDQLTAATDYALPVQLRNLHPSTRYRYRTSNNHTGTFHTAPTKLDPSDAALGEAARKTKFTFLTSSCVKARVPYNPFDHPLYVRGFKILGNLLRKKVVIPDFMMFLGDFIYIDVPKRPSKDTPIVEGYRKHYRQMYASPNWLAVSEDLPWLHVVDDHEIANDWSANNSGIYSYAMEPFYVYQHSVNPPAPRPGVTYYIFNHGTASFFMMDSRRYRSNNWAPDGPEKTMLGEPQKSDLLRWLNKDEPGIHWKILVSSVPFTKNWRYNDEDTWAGYLHERRELLDEMWKVGTEGRGGVIVLSGDRHEFGATAFPPPLDHPAYEHKQAATVHEFSCSPLSQFYLPKRTYVQNDDEDVLIKYIPDGNSKFGAVEVDSTNVAGEQAVLKYRLFVEGKEVWDWVVTADMSTRRIRGDVESKER